MTLLNNLRTSINITIGIIIAAIIMLILYTTSISSSLEWLSVIIIGGLLGYYLDPVGVYINYQLIGVKTFVPTDLYL